MAAIAVAEPVRSAAGSEEKLNSQLTNAHEGGQKDKRGLVTYSAAAPIAAPAYTAPIAASAYTAPLTIPAPLPYHAPITYSNLGVPLSYGLPYPSYRFGFNSYSPYVVA